MFCKMNASKYPVMGMIESRLPELPVAASLNRPCEKGHILMRCLNATIEPILVRSGTTVADYSEVCDGDIHTETGLSLSERVKNSTGVPRKVPAHLQQLFDAAVSGCCDDNQESRLAGLLTKFSDVFSVDNDDVGNTKLVEHSIPVLDGTRPIRQPPHRLGPHKEEEAERQINKLLDKGLIEPASGACSSPVVLVKKKDDSWRFCIDYRRLNTVTIQDAYPLPRIDDSLDALAGSRFFSTLDLTSGYWQVPLDEDTREKSAFITRSGLWKWKVLPFGLTSAPATFQRLMEQVLQGLHWKTLLLYLDDVIVIAPDFNTHIDRLQEVFERLRKAGLKLKPSKCELFQKAVKYLGHIVSESGIATDPLKVEAVKEWQQPKDVKDLQAFLGTAGYYRQYLPNYATVAKTFNSDGRTRSSMGMDS